MSRHRASTTPSRFVIEQGMVLLCLSKALEKSGTADGARVEEIRQLTQLQMDKIKQAAAQVRIKFGLAKHLNFLRSPEQLCRPCTLN